jgi:ribosome-associated protein
VPDLAIAPGVVIPADALEFSAARSGGPGGQHVNKVATKIELRVAIDRIVGLKPDARERLVRLAGSRLTQEGVLIVTADDTRHQFANKEIAVEKLTSLVRASLVAPKVRKATRATRGSQERRLEGKKLESKKKSNRGNMRFD